MPWQRHAKVRGPHHPFDYPLWQTIFEHQLPGCRCSSRAGCVLTPNKLLQGSVGIRPRPSSSRGPLLCWFAPHQSATAAFNHVQTNRDKAETHPHFGKKKTKLANKQTNNSRQSRCESTFSDFLFVSQRIVIWPQTGEATLASSWGSLFQTVMRLKSIWENSPPCNNLVPFESCLWRVFISAIFPQHNL